MEDCADEKQTLQSYREFGDVMARAFGKDNIAKPPIYIFVSSFFWDNKQLPGAVGVRTTMS
jgi:hypothetical protein